MSDTDGRVPGHVTRRDLLVTAASAGSALLADGTQSVTAAAERPASRKELGLFYRNTKFIAASNANYTRTQLPASVALIESYLSSLSPPVYLANVLWGTYQKALQASWPAGFAAAWDDDVKKARNSLTAQSSVTSFPDGSQHASKADALDYAVRMSLLSASSVTSTIIPMMIDVQPSGTKDHDITLSFEKDGVGQTLCITMFCPPGKWSARAPV